MYERAGIELHILRAVSVIHLVVKRRRKTTTRETIAFNYSYGTLLALFFTAFLCPPTVSLIETRVAWTPD